MKKVLSIALAIVLVFSFAACSSKKAKYTVGVCQLVQHDALDNATKGFVDALKAEFGDEIEVLEKNASGEQSNCTTIVNDFISRKVDLIMANATPALQAAAAGTSTISVLGTSVTEYGVALEIDNFSGTVGTNVSGTSDLAPLDKQAGLVKAWFPEAQKVAILYCNSEANSIYQSKKVAEFLAKDGIETKEFQFTDTNDIGSITNAACQWADVIYIPTDNIAAANAEAIGNVVIPAKVPVLTGDASICKTCGIATLSIDYYKLGETTAKMAIKILKGEAKVEEMAIEYDPNPQYLYNAELCTQFGITPLSGYTALTK